MIRPPLTPVQMAAFRQLLALADRRGLTERWAPTTGLELNLIESAEQVPMVSALLEVEETWPGLLTVIQSDPVARFESAPPRVSILLSSWARDLYRDGYFHGQV